MLAGAALVLGVQGRINDPSLVPTGGTFGMEFVLTFLIVYAFCAAKEYRFLSFYSHGNQQGATSIRAKGVPANLRVDAICVGVAYAASLMCWKGSLNPARALGSAFVSQAPGRFEKHWVFWVGPLLGKLALVIP